MGCGYAGEWSLGMRLEVSYVYILTLGSGAWERGYTRCRFFFSHANQSGEPPEVQCRSRCHCLTSMSVSPQGMAGGSQEFAMQEVVSGGMGSPE